MRRQLEPVTRIAVPADAAIHAAAWMASICAVAGFSAFALARHRGYQSAAYDFGFFDQVVWNTSRGDWFETTFVAYNFLGQHFEPILLLFAGLYRLGGGPETMLLAQSLAAGAAAIPLFHATSRLTDSRGAGLALAVAYLLNPALHRALDFDFHPEVMAFPLVFGAVYFLAVSRPWASVATILPVLLLKEDMAILVLAFAAIFWLRRHRRQACTLGVAGLTWIAMAMFVLMPAVRGGPSDLNQRYAYLTRDTEAAWRPAIATWRATDRLATSTAPSAIELEATLAGLALLHPAALLAAVPAVLNGPSGHPEQSRLELHYSVLPLALSVVAAAFALGDIAAGRRWGRIPGSRWNGLRMPAANSVLVIAAASSFVVASPFSPFADRDTLDADHRRALAEAIEQIPDDASVSAQGTLLPHLSQRREVWEFPDIRDSDYVIVDAALPITAQSRAAGYESVLRVLPARGYSTIWEWGTIRVFRREFEE